MTDTTSLAKILWNFNVLNQKVEKADCIIALGNSDIRTAQVAARLFNDGYGDILVTTGGFGRLTKDLFTKPEARLFADEAIELGVPSDKIFIEDKSSNTFDNIRFTKKLLNEQGIVPKTILIVTKPYMERRAFATALATWSDVHIIVASPDLDFDTYPNDVVSSELLINMVVGDTQRLMIFSESAHVPKQDFSNEVVEAYNRLIELGYNKQVISQENIPNLLNAVTAGNNT
jgi:uncharacterized SAM-binding protein YcdF (DUF218 family)